jgi:hypothetical protein
MSPARALAVACILFAPTPLLAQQVTGVPGSPSEIEHTIPFLMAIDESFDVGIDTRTGVDDSYKLPFRFSGTINKLTTSWGKSS